MCSTASLIPVQPPTANIHEVLYEAIRKGRESDVEAHINIVGIQIINSKGEKTFIEITIPSPFIGKSITVTPLHYAISSQQWVIAKLFVTRFPKLLWVQDSFGHLPIISLLRSKARTKQEEIEELYIKMLELGPSLDSMFNGISTLHELCRSTEFAAPKLIQATKTYLIKVLEAKRLKRCNEIVFIMKETFTSWPIELFPLVTGFLSDDAQLKMDTNAVATLSNLNSYQLLSTGSTHLIVWCNSSIFLGPFTPWRFAMWNKNESALELCIQLGLEPAHIYEWTTTPDMHKRIDLSLFLRLYEKHSRT